jgi:hypothetical protein
MTNLYPVQKGKAYPLAQTVIAPSEQEDLLAAAEHRLAEAKHRLVVEEDRDHSGNNPNKGRAYLRRLRLEVISLEFDLKWRQTATPEQIAQADLDAMLNGRHPDARSRTVVEHDGEHYQLKVKPISFSYGTPTDWSRSWSPTDLPVGEPPQKKQKHQLRPEFLSVQEIMSEILRNPGN